jgi:hypothetical protein
MPDWLIAVSCIWLGLAATCSLAIVIDLIAGHQQHMAIMNLVWPITALYGGPIALAAYFLIGRSDSHAQTASAHLHGGGAAHAAMGKMAGGDEMQKLQHSAQIRGQSGSRLPWPRRIAAVDAWWGIS